LNFRRHVLFIIFRRSVALPQLEFQAADAGQWEPLLLERLTKRLNAEWPRASPAIGARMLNNDFKGKHEPSHILYFRLFGRLIEN
jgi:hypothetical protein